MKRPTRDAEVGQESFWGRPRRSRFPLSGSFVVDAVAGAVAVIVVFTIAALLAPRMTDKQLQAAEAAHVH